MAVGARATGVHDGSCCASTERVRGEEGNQEEHVVEKNGEQVSIVVLHYIDMSEEVGACIQPWWGVHSHMDDALAFLRARCVQRSGQGGSQIGPATGRFGPWAQKQSCSP